MAPAEVNEQPARSGRAPVVGFAVLAVAVAAYFALGMPGMDHSGAGGTMAGMEHASAGEPMALSPQAFADHLADGGVFVVNVHVPAGPATVHDGTCRGAGNPGSVAAGPPARP